MSNPIFYMDITDNLRENTPTLNDPSQGLTVVRLRQHQDIQMSKASARSAGWMRHQKWICTRNLWRFRHGSRGIRVSFSRLLEGIPRRPSPGCVPRKEATDHRIPRSTHWGYGLKSYVQHPKQYDNVLQRPFPLLVKWVAVERSKQHPI